MAFVSMHFNLSRSCWCACLPIQDDLPNLNLVSTILTRMVKKMSSLALIYENCQLYVSAIRGKDGDFHRSHRFMLDKIRFALGPLTLTANPALNSWLSLPLPVLCWTLWRTKLEYQFCASFANSPLLWFAGYEPRLPPSFHGNLSKGFANPATCHLNDQSVPFEIFEKQRSQLVESCQTAFKIFYDP